MANDNQQYVGRAMVANCHLSLPTGHKVAPGETFRYLQAHADGGASAAMWIRCRQVTLAPDGVAIPLPAEPVGPGGRRRQRWQPQPTAADVLADPAPVVEDAPADLAPEPVADLEGVE